jgi:hypothetical protein
LARARDGHEVVDLAGGRLALHYAEENPDEVVAALDDEIEALIRELEAQRKEARAAQRHSRTPRGSVCSLSVEQRAPRGIEPLSMCERAASRTGLAAPSPSEHPLWAPALQFSTKVCHEVAAKNRNDRLF